MVGSVSNAQSLPRVLPSTQASQNLPPAKKNDHDADDGGSVQAQVKPLATSGVGQTVDVKA